MVGPARKREASLPAAFFTIEDNCGRTLEDQGLRRSRPSGLSAFAAGFTGFIAVPLMRHTLAMGGSSAFAGNALLLFGIHGGKTTVRLSAFPTCTLLRVHH